MAAPSAIPAHPSGLKCGRSAAERPDRDTEHDRQEPADHGQMQPAEQADRALAVPELLVGQSADERVRCGLPTLVHRAVIHPVRRAHRLVAPRPFSHPEQREHEQHHHQHPERDLAGRVPGDEMPAQRGQPPLIAGEPGSRHLVGVDVRADHHGDQGRVHRQRQSTQAGRQAVQPEPPGRRAGPGRTHPAAQVGEQERQQGQPEHPDLAPRGQATPGEDFDVTVHVLARVPVPVSGAMV